MLTLGWTESFFEVRDCFGDIEDGGETDSEPDSFDVVTGPIHIVVSIEFR